MRAAIHFLGLTFSILLVPGSIEGNTGSTDPGLGVARVSYVSGNVTTMRGNSGDWIATRVNMPVVEGDTVRAAGIAKVEIQMDQGNFVRLGDNSEVQFIELASKRFRIRVIEGTAVYSELADSDADTDIETPLAVVRPMMEGRYTVIVYPEEVAVEVREGHAEVAFEASTGQLPSGKTMIVRKSAAGIHFETVDLAPPSELDKWASARDKNMRRVVSNKYLSRDIYGGHDLDDHGHWRYIDGVGHCWFPKASNSWVPYRNGHWMWIDYYGWNWVGNEPWGWAPYHWGRWHRHPAHGWGWFPGSPRLRHTWRPALVAFFGYSTVTPGRVFAGSVYGGIGWAPLAPGERFLPWYGQRYYSGNSTTVLDNRVIVVNNYRNARNFQGVSYVDSRDLGSSARQTPRAIRTGEVQQATAIRGPLPVVPYRASQGRIVVASGSDRARALQNPLRASVTALRDGTARVPFDSQQERVRRSVQSFRRATESPTTNRVADSANTPELVGGRISPAGGGTAGNPTARSASGPAARVPTAEPASAPRVGALSTTRRTQSATAPASATRATVAERTRAAVSQAERDGTSRAATAAPSASQRRSASSGPTARVPTSRSSASQAQAGSSASSPVFMPRSRSRLTTRSPVSGSSPTSIRPGTRSSSPSYSQRTRSQSTTRSPSYGSSSSRRSSPSYGSSSSRSSSPSYRSSPSYGSSSSRSSSPTYRSSPSYGSSSSRSSSPSYGSSSSRSSSPSSGSSSSSRSSSSSSRSSSSIGSSSSSRSSSSSSRSSSSSPSSSSRSSTSSSRSPSR